MAGKLVLKEYKYDGGDDVKLTVLEGGEIMLEVNAVAIETTDDLHDLADWLNDKATQIATKFATGEF